MAENEARGRGICKTVQELPSKQDLNPQTQGTMGITTTAEHPFEKCYFDVVGPISVTMEGNKHILTFQDDLSKYVVAVPMGKGAETVARAFVEKIVLTYGRHASNPANGSRCQLCQ